MVFWYASQSRVGDPAPSASGSAREIEVGVGWVVSRLVTCETVVHVRP